MHLAWLLLLAPVFYFSWRHYLRYRTTKVSATTEEKFKDL